VEKGLGRKKEFIKIKKDGLARLFWLCVQNLKNSNFEAEIFVAKEVIKTSVIGNIYHGFY